MSKNKPIPTVSKEQDGAVTTVVSEKPLRVMFTSDVHFDSVYCNREQFFADMDYAKRIGALVIFAGDFFDAMQGRFDPRRDMESVRPEHRYEDYYDRIRKDAAVHLRKWRNNILMMTHGNHEDGVLKNANTNILGNLLDDLRTPNYEIIEGGYGGIINLTANGMNFPIKYFHGSGGEAPVTKGAIQTNRQAVYLDGGFVIVVNGHNHNAYWIPITKERLNPETGQHEFVNQHHLRTPGYMMSWGDGTRGWEVSRGGVPKPVGSIFVEFGFDEEQPMRIIPHIHAPVPIAGVQDIYDGPVYPQE